MWTQVKATSVEPSTPPLSYPKDNAIFLIWAAEEVGAVHITHHCHSVVRMAPAWHDRYLLSPHMWKGFHQHFEILTVLDYILAQVNLSAYNYLEQGVMTTHHFCCSNHWTNFISNNIRDLLVTHKKVVVLCSCLWHSTFLQKSNHAQWK